MLLTFAASDAALIFLLSCCFVSPHIFHAQLASLPVVRAGGLSRTVLLPLKLQDLQDPAHAGTALYFLVSVLAAWMEAGAKSPLVLQPKLYIFKDIWSVLDFPSVFPKFTISGCCLLA